MKSLLVIDDNALILKFCQMVLAKAGIRVFAAATPVAGLQILDLESSIDVVLLDVGFSSPSYLDVLTALEREPKTQHLRILLMAAKGQEFPECSEVFPSVWGVMQKPLLPSILLQNVSQAMKPEATEFVARRRSLADPENRLTPNRAIPMQAQVPALQGHLDAMSVPEILQLLCLQGKTGIFRVHRERQEICVFFDKGTVQLASSRNLEENFQLGSILVDTQALHPGQLRQALNQKNGTDLALGQYLLKLQYVHPKVLQNALNHQTSMLIYEMLRWKTGSFVFETMEALPDLARSAGLGLAIQELLLEGFRRIDEWQGRASTALN